MDESSARVGKETFSQELSEFNFISKKWTSDVDTFGSDNCNSLTWIIEAITIEESLCDVGG